MKNFHLYHFAGQKNGERILLVVRRHWFNILSQFFTVFLMIGILAGSYFYLPLFFPSLQEQLPASLFVFMESLFAMLIWIILFLVWIDYYFDVWIITNYRVVNIEQKGLFNREVSELELEKIQDITTEVIGIIPTFLNYGDVFMQTAGETERFCFRNVPDPYDIKDLVMNLQKAKLRQKSEELGEMIQQKIYSETV